MQEQITTIKKNWENIQNRIQTALQSAGREKEKIKVLPITKAATVEQIKCLQSLDFSAFGENRLEVFEKKKDHFINDSLEWHFIGNIQSRKIRQIIIDFQVIHSISRLKEARKISATAKELNKIPDVFLEVNVSGETQKEGFSPEELKKELSEIIRLPCITLKGLMTMAPFTDNQDIIRQTFCDLRLLLQNLQSDDHPEFCELSMGMTNDFPIAIEEGATLVRIGTAFFQE